MLNNNKLPVGSNNRQHVCLECEMAKSHNLPFYASTHFVSKPLELIYSDIWGPARLFLAMDLVIMFVFSMSLQNSFGYVL